jgi:threonine dehydratase
LSLVEDCVGLLASQLRVDATALILRDRGSSAGQRSKVVTIADSLGPPYSLQYSFELCRAAIDDLVTVSDDALRRAMDLLFGEMRLAVEPAAAASTAAALGPLADRLRGKRVALILSGTNIDLDTYTAWVQPVRQGPPL